MSSIDCVIDFLNTTEPTKHNFTNKNSSIKFLGTSFKYKFSFQISKMALSIANDLRFSISVAFWEAITSLSKFLFSLQKVILKS